jgi:hypothetical protein
MMPTPHTMAIINTPPRNNSMFFPFQVTNGAKRDRRLLALRRATMTSTRGVLTVNVIVGMASVMEAPIIGFPRLP